MLYTYNVKTFQRSFPKNTYWIGDNKNFLKKHSQITVTALVEYNWIVETLSLLVQFFLKLITEYIDKYILKYFW